MSESPAGNWFNKYQSRNPAVRLLTENFWRAFDALVSPLEVKSVLEVGCGEGWISGRIRDQKPGAQVVSTDLSEDILETASTLFPDGAYSAHSAYALGFKDKAFDLVILCEVCEHLTRPETALREASRVSRKWILLSVPQEPLWRILNLARGAYLSDWGNTPGHVQHWSKRHFIRLVQRHFGICVVRNPLPWTFVLATP